MWVENRVKNGGLLKSGPYNILTQLFLKLKKDEQPIESVKTQINPNYKK